MNKATKGPWKIQTDGKGFWWIDKITRDGGFSICNCGTSKEAEANARLISAAPELLEACKNALTWLIDRESCSIETLYGLEKNLKQAIAKAEGVSNA